MDGIMANIDERLMALLQSAEMMAVEGRQLVKSVAALERAVAKLERISTTTG